MKSLLLGREKIFFRRLWQLPSLQKHSSSYAHGTSAVPLLGETIGRYFEQQVLLNRSKIAVVVRHQSIRWTYEQLNEICDCFAKGLIDIGVKTGDRVGIWSPNNSEWLVTQLATAKIGAILVNINPAYKDDELKYALNLVEVSTLVMSPSLKSLDYIEILNKLAPELSKSRPGSFVSDPRGCFILMLLRPRFRAGI